MWAARDTHDLLSEYGFRVYCYDRQPDEAHGFLHSRLRDIYADSCLNILFWSKAYSVKSKDSFVAMERRAIVHRHVELGRAESIAVLLMDETLLERDLETILGHPLQKVGILGFQSIIVERLKGLYSQRSEHGNIAHPPETESVRGQMFPCVFTIDSAFDTDYYKRWAKLADVLVRLKRNTFQVGDPLPPKTHKVYLIPSGLASPLIRNTMLLTRDPSFLEIKRKATEEFIDKNEDVEPSGFWFRQRIGDAEVAAVYCPVYDTFLNAYLSNAVKAPKN
jgi:hypothetical protein